MSNKRKTKGVPDNVDRYVGERIKEARKEIGVSQEKLAEAIGLTFQQIQKYERGMNRVSCGRIAQIAHALNQPVTFFFPDLYTKSESRVYKLNITTLKKELSETHRKLDFISGYVSELLTSLKAHGG